MCQSPTSNLFNRWFLPPREFRKNSGFVTLRNRPASAHPATAARSAVATVMHVARPPNASRHNRVDFAPDETTFPILPRNAPAKMRTMVLGKRLERLGEGAIRSLDREIPAGQISDENRAARKRSISHDKTARQSSLIVFQPEFQFQIIYYLDKEEMVAADPIDCRRPNFTTRRDAGCHRFCRIVAQQVGEREIGSGTLFEKISALSMPPVTGRLTYCFCSAP